ncbi:MAG: serine hydrolase [Labilithrix sp.]|nr:serine hydrolase [Labilithrix sp.]
MTQPGSGDSSAYKEERLELETIARRFEGTLGLCSARIDGPDAVLEVGGDEVFPAASVIKIALALEVFCQVEEGALALGERVPLKASDKVIGSGVLAELTEGIAPTVGDLVYLAMAISDNTAANLLVERVGVFSVNARLAALGLEKTRLSGKILVHETKSGPPATEDFGASASAVTDGDDGRGERSPVTARELVTLLRRVYRRDGLPAPACEALLDLLQKTQTASSIRRGLPEARFRDRTPARLFHKTGSIRGVVNDAGVVATERGAYAVALLSKGSRDLRPTQDNVARIALADASRVIYKAMREE